MLLDQPKRLAGSFRDPAGHVFTSGDRILRTVSPAALPAFASARPVLRRLVDEGRLVDFVEHEPAAIDLSSTGAALVLEHPAIAHWSYPYEWPFSLLKDAALFHLDLHLDLLDADLTLSDASAYNVQFRGTRPVFIDHLSIRPYRDGEFWLGHRQFCEQFLNPLLLRAYCGIAPNAWYRGNLEGLPTGDLARLLPLRRKLGWRTLSHVTLPARLQSGATSEKAARGDLRERKLPKIGFAAMLRQLRRWIADLRPADTSATVWANYATTTTYDDEEQAAKRAFVSDFVRSTGAARIVDLGCNTGDYSVACLEAGAASVTGFDFDQNSLDKAAHRSKADGLAFLPLFLDARNPSPAQGWMQTERQGFGERYRADAVIALAFEHHLAIAHNAPLTDVVRWITSLAPRAVIEWVPKEDPTIRKMLALREDIFEDYHEDGFVAAIEAVGRVTRRQTVSSSGRTMYEIERRS